MRFLLINTNPAVSKLVNASLNRIGHEVKEIGGYNDLPLDSFIAVIVDSDSYNASHIDDLLAVSIAPALIYFKQQDAPTPEGFQYALAKPFLPTDFITFIVSILKKYSELKRFITPEAEEFVSMLPEEGKVEAKEEKSIETPVPDSEEQAIENNFINFNFYDDLQKKEPIFNAEEQKTESIESAFSAPKIEPDKTDDVFFNLSDDIGKLYSSNKTAEESAGENVIEQTQKAADAEIPKSIDIHDAADEKNKTDDDFAFDMNNFKKTVLEVRDENIKTDTPLWAEQNKTDDKVNFDFDIMDNIEQTKQQEKEFSPVDDFLKVTTDETEKAKKIDDFEGLAKEFDDLITAPHVKKDISKDTKLPAYAIESEEKNPLESLNEKEVKKALQDGGLLPQSAEEMVKSEIQSVVQDSVQGLLQGNILREVLKGLKMNITITFEDKE
jgi:uncharacterized membrane protein